MTSAITGSSMQALLSDAAKLQQGSSDWLAARVGCVTASRIADVVVRTKTGYGAARQAYMGQLLSERLTGLPCETYQNAAMRWGSEMEVYAVAAYEDLTGVETQTTGFLQHPRLAYAGASPDRLIAEDGLLEVKCLTTATHIDTLLSRKVPERYVLQMQWQMACSGRLWCDFMSFDPRVPEAYSCFITRLERDDDQITKLEGEVSIFLDEIEQKLDALDLCCVALDVRRPG